MRIPEEKGMEESLVQPQKGCREGRGAETPDFNWHQSNPTPLQEHSAGLEFQGYLMNPAAASSASSAYPRRSREEGEDE